MRFGFHLSISGGLHRAVEQGLRTGCEAGQIFSRNPRGWKFNPLSEQEINRFKQARRDSGLTPMAIHLPYLPNPAASDPELRKKSIHGLAEELRRADQLEIDFVVLHPGHVPLGMARDEAIDQAAEGIVQALGDIPPATTLLLETTSGRRGELGESFDELARIIARAEAMRDYRLGVCLDTAHIWGAGYDLRGKTGLENTIKQFEQEIGLDRLHLIHLNDSLGEFGSRVDRHAPVGRGHIGARNMARFVRHPDLVHLPAIMETPRETEADDLANMARVKRWRAGR